MTGYMYEHGVKMDDFQVYKCICRVPESIENEMEKLLSIHRFQVDLEVISITIAGSMDVLPNVCPEISLSNYQCLSFPSNDIKKYSAGGLYLKKKN